MNSLQTAIDELAAEPLEWVPVDRLGDDLVELRRKVDALESQWTRRIGEFDARGGHEVDGSLSTTAWLRARCLLAAGTAREGVRVARALRHMPLTEKLFRAGELSVRRVRELVHARKAHPELFARDEHVLVDAARTLGVRALRTAFDYWRQAADTDAAIRDAEHRHRRRRLHVSTTFEGMVRIDGDLDPESGQVVQTAIAALAEPGGRDGGNDRTPAQRRADALTDICRDFLDHGDRPQHGGEKPHVTVTVDLAVLEDRAAGTAEYDDGTVVDPETVRRIACDTRVTRVVTDGDSQPLDVGRATRVVPPAMRRALVARDGGCTWDGCDRPARWTDAHHIVHWAHGGHTNLENLQLLCRPHHRAAHARDGP